MRFISRRRTGAAETGIAKIVAALYRSARQCSAVFISRASGQRKDAAGDIDHRPVPPAAAGRRIGIPDGDREAARPRRGIFPCQLRRDIASGTAETGKPVLPGQRLPVMHIIAAHAKRRGHRAAAHSRYHRHSHADTCFHRLLLVGVRKQGMRVRTS